MKVKWPIIVIVVFGLFIMAYVFFSPDKEKAVVKIETFSVESELSKDFCAIKIIQIVDTVKAVDAFGNPLCVNAWYARCNSTMSVFPLSQQGPDNISIVGPEQLESLSFPLSGRFRKEFSRINISNGTPAGFYVEAQVLLLGKETLGLRESCMYQEAYVW